jgi:drug/metabolite transporter superfamily protein YnfA
MGAAKTSSGKKTITKLIIAFIISLLAAYIISVLFDRNLIMYAREVYKGSGAGSGLSGIIKSALSLSSLNGIRLMRIELIFVVLMFICLHFVLNVKKMYAFLFKNRWAVGGILLLFLAVNGFNGNSLSAYDTYVQPGEGSEYIYPVIGRERLIRSDEWLVNSSFSLPAYHNGGIEYGITSIIFDPFLIISDIFRVVLGANAQYSYDWYYKIILTFLVTNELFLLITKKKKLLSLTSTMMITFSSFYLWWGFPPFILFTSGAAVCFYYFFRSDKWWQKALFLYGTAISGYGFVTNLYPAWQVPFGFLLLILLIWVILENIDIIKKYNWKQWLIIGIGIAVFLLAVAYYLYSIRDYIISAMSSVYPGRRRSQGGMSLQLLFDYIPAIFFSVIEPYKMNASESGAIISFFPVPMIMSLYYMIKTKKKDFLVTGLTVISVILLIYCSCGMPPLLAVCTLMSFSTPSRAQSILGVYMVFFFAILFSRYLDAGSLKTAETGKHKQIKRKLRADEDKDRKNLIFSLSAAIITSALSMYIAYRASMGYPERGAFVYFFYGGLFILYALIFYFFFRKISRRRYNILMGLIICICLATGLFVRPVEYGMDAVYSKPAAKEIEKIVKEDPDSVWIAYNTWAVQSFSSICGANTINRVNTSPDIELWEKVDPEHKYEDIYNRYAHIEADFSADDQTSFTLNVDDNFTIHIAYEDLEKLDIDYIISTEAIDAPNDFFDLENIYQEGNIYIYKVNYK